MKLYEIEKMVREEAVARFDFDGPGLDVSEAAHEIADSSVPVYTHYLLALAAEYIDFATRVPEIGPALDGSPTPVNIIAANIYEHLYAIAANELQELIDEYDA